MRKKRFYKKLAANVLVISFLLVTLLSTTTTYAWLSTTWHSGTFSIKTSVLSAPALEIWTYHKTDDATTEGWYKTYKDSDTPLEKKAVESIGTITEENSGNTFEPEGDFSLYFGTINNLADEQDNLPVYVKFTIPLEAHTVNNIKLSCQLPDDYLDIYQLGKVAGKPDTGKRVSADLEELLRNTTTYDFINMEWAISDNESDIYPLSDTSPAELPDGFEDFFDSYTMSDTLKAEKKLTSTKNAKGLSVTWEESQSARTTIYLYLKFSIKPDTLQAALSTDLKEIMPVYLIFNTKFSLDIESKSDGEPNVSVDTTSSAN